MTTCEVMFCQGAPVDGPVAVVDDAEVFQFAICLGHRTAIANGAPADVGWTAGPGGEQRPVLLVGGLRCGLAEPT